MSYLKNINHVYFKHHSNCYHTQKCMFYSFQSNLDNANCDDEIKNKRDLCALNALHRFYCFNLLNYAAISLVQLFSHEPSKYFLFLKHVFSLSLPISHSLCLSLTNELTILHTYRITHIMISGLGFGQSTKTELWFKCDHIEQHSR
jgi:hypothetical protein